MAWSGDLIHTGTATGVGAVKPGDKIEEQPLRVTIGGKETDFA